MDIEDSPHEEKQGCSTSGMVTFILGLISGTFSALLCKMAYDTKAEGLQPGEVKAFAKPIMMLTLMFVAMTPAMLFWKIQQYFTPDSKKEIIPMKTMIILIIPSLCDLLCTLLLLVAQLYITASLWQMMRGSIIIITALLKRYVLDHRLKLHMWLGVSLITLAMLLVASTSFFSSSTDSTSHEVAPGNEGKDPRIGILLVVVGCLAQGVQYVFEEKVMAVDNAPPLVVIGCEGLWGTLLSITVVYPLAYVLPGSDNGSFENPFDALAMINNSPQLFSLAVMFVITVTMYNCAAVYVTKYLSAIWHAILDNFRPITIWGLDLAIFYVFLPNQGFGEPWIDGSWLQLGGLVILLFGTAVYNGSIWTFSDMNYEALSTSEFDIDSKKLIKTDITMASPSMSRSPLVYNQARMQSNGSFGNNKTVSYGSMKNNNNNTKQYNEV